jgi:hypothetical protein
MKNANRRTLIAARAQKIGLTVETNCPGDEIRRYYFVLPNGRSDGTGDLQLAGPIRGAKEAELWLSGFERRHCLGGKR